ncbi:MAG: DNRLRE domain-containing protein [Verrucomicrobiaceae bacterium]|nr:DNRLRE domain-containing protein [Verrucomicrobiaceae bacterium]
MKTSPGYNLRQPCCLLKTLMVCLLMLGTTWGNAANIIHDFYVPMPESQVRTAFVAIEPASGVVGTTMESVISIVATGTGTIIHYDEWEDGYEVDINNPVQATTKIWGDGNNANGVPPGMANDPAGLSSGAVINLRNLITLPRNPSAVLYDGRDRFGGTKALVVTRTSWATTPGSVLAGSVEVTATTDYGYEFTSPVGQDVSAASMFEYVGLMVMARENATSVTVDVNGPATGGATTFTLNQGESYLVNGGVLKGAKVTANKPVQAQLITGDIGARFETDWFTLYPQDQWSSRYFSPVGTASDGDPAYAFLYNPSSSPITINHQSKLGSGTFSIPAYGVYQHQLAQNSGTRYTQAADLPFFGIVMVGANPSANNVHDWGFTLVPSDSLTTEAVVGWGPGSSDLSQNGSPVWVMPEVATRLYVDYDGDRDGSQTDPKNNKYDVHYDLTAYSSKIIYDPDKDQSAMRVYTLDGTLITAAWGQDPGVAGPGNPFLDVGTTVLPFPVPTMVKSVTLAIDTAPTGYSVGDTVEYSINVDNKGLLPLGNLLVLDPLNPSLTYVAGSTKRDGSPVADNTTGTVFPLDEVGYVIPIIQRGGSTKFSYRCVINAAGSINNTASNANYNLTSTSEVVVPPGGGSTACGAQFTDSIGTVMTSYAAGASVYATLTDPDANNNSSAVEQITVVINNTSNGDAEFLTLVETTASSGIFRNTSGLVTSLTAGSSQMDSTLLVAPGNSLSFTYTDPEFNETCSGNATVSVPTQTKVLYLSTNGTGTPDQDMDRVDPVATGDSTTATSETLSATVGGLVSTTLSATKDTWLNSVSSTLNYGSSTTFNIDRQGGGVGEERAMLQFDLSSIPTGAVITSAQLVLTKTGGATVTQNVDLYRVTNTWTEGTQNGSAGAASWSQRQSGTSWTSAGGDYNSTADASVPVSTNGNYTWDIASLVQGWVNGSIANNGIMLASPDTGGDNSQQFASDENATSTIRPKLEVTYNSILQDGPATTVAKSHTIGTVTTTHTTGSGANRLMLVGISYEDDNTLGLTITGVTYAGQPLTFVKSQMSSQEAGCELWRLVNPPSGVGTLEVSTTGSGTGDEIVVGVATFAGVNQTTPLGTAVSATNSTATASVTATSASGELVFDVLALDDARSASPDSAQTQLWSATSGTVNSDGIRAGGSTKLGSASTAMTWNVTADAWTLIAVPIKPVSISSATTFSQTPSFASPFSLPSGGPINVTSYVNVISGTLPASPSVTAELKYGTTTVANLTSPTYNSGAGTLIWSGTLGSNVTIPAGQLLDLVVTSNQNGVSFTVQYDSATAPSKVSLPTTTVINVDSLAVYDAPYPGGSLVTAPASGTTVYIRSTASDPFGAYDITSMGLSVDGPGTAGDFTTTLGGGHVVATGTGTKTYEYSWVVGSTIGTYNIFVTAHEGTEGIQAQRATSVNVTFLDLGTPSVTEFTAGLNGVGTPTYAGNEQVCVRVTDLDQDLNATVVETVTAVITSATGDREVVTLTETGIHTGVFVYCIPASTTGGTGQNDGTLHAEVGDLLTVVYVDPTDSTDTSSDTATVPPPPGVDGISVTKTLVSPSDGVAVIGESVSFSIQIVNTGSNALATVPVTDTFDSTKLAFVSASPPPSSTGAGSLTWSNVGPLSSGQSVTLNVTFTALAPAAPTTNVASATGGTAGDSDSADVTVTNPHVSITKSRTSAPSAEIGDNVTFDIVLTNDGSTAIASLPLEDTFSAADFEFVSASLPPDAIGAGSLLWLDATGPGNLALGGSVTISVTLKAKGSANPAVNLARAEYTVDVNGDSPPAVQSSATVTLVAASISGSVIDDVDNSGGSTVGDLNLADVTVKLYTDPDGDGDPADGELVGITTTSASGTFSFPNLPLGKYVIVEIDPVGYGSSADSSGLNDNRVAVDITSYIDYSGVFYDHLPDPDDYAAVAGTVWNDTNVSGDFSAGETGIANVVVDLIQDVNANGFADVGEPVYQSTQTAADGSYSFAGLPPGDYVIVERDLFGWASTSSNQIAIGAVAGNSYTGRDFFDVQQGQVTGRVFHDANGNGVFDSGSESVMAGVDVIVLDQYNTQTVVTDVNGVWIASVVPGNVNVDVKESDPDFTSVFVVGYEQTAGIDPSAVTAVSGVTTDAGDDGYRQVGIVTGHLYLDVNGNGSQDIGEPNLGDVDVVITDVDLVEHRVTTDGNGDWTAWIPPGAASVDVDETDPQYPSGSDQTEGTDPTPVIAVANATISAGEDGYFVPASISGHVYLDVNGNGTQDVGEPSISGLDVLVTDSNGQTQTVTTDSSGDWTAEVPPGNTTADVSNADPQFPAGAVQTQGSDPSAVVAVGGQNTSAGIDGFYVPGTLTGHVYLDVNGDGNQDSGEPNLGQVDVQITDSNGNPQTVSTDASGNWSATVPPGLTTIDVQNSDPDMPTGVVQTDGLDPSTAVAVANSTVSAGNDGFFIPATITGHVYLDTNGDGDQDVGEPDLASLDIEITDANNAVQTVVTDPNGNWSASVPPGASSVNVVNSDPQLPSGVIQTEGNDPTVVTAVAGASTGAGIDGYFLPGTVNGHLYVDTNGNAQQDPGEPDLANVDVIVTDANGVIHIVETDSAGDWSLDVPPGMTVANVDELDPQFPASAAQTEGSDPTTVFAVAGVAISAGVDGYVILATVTGHLYIDVNGNGTQDLGEPNLADVDVIVTDVNNLQQTITTDPSGNWSVNVPPGTTTAKIVEADPQYPVESTQTEGDDPSGVIAVAATSVSAGVDGFYFPTSVTGHLYLDTNGDGDQDPGEPDIAGVDVLVTNVNGVTSTVTSDSNGIWVASVPPGQTVANVDETDPDFPVNSIQTDGADPTTVTAVVGSVSDAGYDGYYIPAILEGHLYLDVNGNGAQDLGEPNLSNVTVTVTDSGGADHLIATNGSGNWSVLVPPGVTSIKVDEFDPDYPAGSIQTDGDDPTVINALAGVTNDGGDDGYFVPATIFGHLYLDTNGDGDQDPGEPDIANVDVLIGDSNGNSQTVTSDSSGNWLALVPPGITTVDVDNADPEFPVGSSQTQGSDPGVVSALAGVSVDAGIDGYFIPAIVTGNLYLDVNGNGLQDIAEPDLPNVDLIITDANGGSMVVATGPDGAWTASLPPGSTSVNVDEADPDYPAGAVHTQGDDPTSIVALAGQTTNGGIDGYFVPATLTGHVYLDTNGNGIQDSGEPDLAAISVEVTDSNLQTHIIETDLDGNWSIQVPPGNTSVLVMESDPDFPSGAIQTEGTNPGTVVAVAGASLSGGVDGYYRPAEISGHVYLDVNGNGSQDSSEPDLADIDVFVVDSNGNSQTVTTDSSGNWSATVPPGVSAIDIDNADTEFPAGGVQTEGTDPGLVIAVAAQTTHAGNDGYFIPGFIEGSVAKDTDNDDLPDSGVNLATINIYSDPNGDGDPSDGTLAIGPIMTNASGSYSSGQLPPGSYVVIVEPVPDTLHVLEGDRTDAQDDSSDANVSNRMIAVTIAAGETDDGNDFLVEEPASIGNLVWHDIDNNGVRDLGETGIVGVTIELLDDLGNSIDSDPLTSGVQSTITVTDGSGAYAFTGIRPGSYQLRILAPPVLYPLSSTVTDELDNGEDGDDNGVQSTTTGPVYSPVFLVMAGETETTLDFGFLETEGLYSISGQVRDDFDADANFSDNDQPVPNVTIRLFADSNGSGTFEPGVDTLLDTTLTDGLGNYVFLGLPNGTYFVQETDPVTASSTADTESANDNLIKVLIKDVNRTDNNFLDAVDPHGYAYSPVNGQIIPGGSISVSGPGSVTILMDGSTGQYSFVTDGTTGTYTITYTPPLGYMIDPSRPVAGASYDPPAVPGPVALGSSENPSSQGYLTDYSAPGNPYYFTFDLTSGDPFIINNNIPLVEIKPSSFVAWQYANPLSGDNGTGDDPDSDGTTNLEEFAFCYPPATGVNGSCPLQLVRQPGNTVDAKLRTVTGIQGVTYTLQSLSALSASPGGWVDVAWPSTSSPNVDGTTTVTFAGIDALPAFASGQGFLRVKVSLSAPVTQATTAPVGFSKRTFGVTCATFSMPYFSCPVMSGEIEAVAGDVVDCTTSAGSASIVANLVPGAQYYLEITDGPYEGHRLEVNEAGTTPVSIAIDSANARSTLQTVQPGLSGSHFLLCRHHTIGSLLPAASFPGHDNNPALADRILMHNGTIFQVYWLYRNGGSPKWVLSSDINLNDAAGTIIPSGAGLFVHPKKSAVSSVFVGKVRTNDYVQPLPLGSTLVGGGWPMDQSPDGRAMSTTTGFGPSRNPSYADKVLHWVGDTQPGSNAYRATAYLLLGGVPRWSSESDVTLQPLNASPIFKSLHATFFKIQSAKPTYTMPLPWTP